MPATPNNKSMSPVSGLRHKQVSREERTKKRYFSYVTIYVFCLAIEYVQRLFGVDYQKHKGFVKTEEGPLNYIEAFLDLGWEVLLYAAILLPIIAWLERTKYSEDYERSNSDS